MEFSKHNDNYVLILTPEDMNDLLVTVERARKGSIVGPPVTELSHFGGPTIPPSARVQGCTYDNCLTVHIEKLYSDMREMAKQVRPE